VHIGVGIDGFWISRYVCVCVCVCVYISCVDISFVDNINCCELVGIAGGFSLVGR
jgi:hypothetical protein